MKKKILVIQRDPLLSGVQKVFLSEYECLKDHYEYYLICSSKGQLTDLFKSEKVYFVSEMKRDINLILDILAIIKIMFIINKVKPDIIHTHSSKPGIYAALLKIVCKFKLIHTVHGFSFYSGQNYIKYKIFSKIEGYFGKIRDMNIVLTNRDYCKAISIGISPKRIMTVPNAPDKIKILKKITKINNSFCWMGRFEPQKDPMTFIKAAIDYINTNNDQSHFAIWGDGSLRSIMELEVNKLPTHLKKNISINGWCLNPIETLSQYENYITTSLYEGMPLVMLEAMVAKCYIIATDIPEHRETMDGQDAKYFNIEDCRKLNLIFSEIVSQNKRILEKNYIFKTIEERAMELDSIYMKV